MPEKTLQQIPRMWREQYQKGLDAFQRSNLDYAITILSQVLEKEPEFFDCRKALRATQYKKAGEKSGFFKKFVGTASSSPMIARGQMTLRNNPREAVNIAEQILNGDPHNSMAHKLLADAALAADLPRTAILSLEILIKNSPKDSELARELADAYAMIGEVKKAEEMYAELIRQNPGDPELSQAYKNLSAQRTLDEGGYEALADGKGSYRDILKDKAETVALEQENRQVKDEDVAARLIADYQARLEKEPENLKLMRSIAELYAQKKEFDNALLYYNHMLSLGTGDPAIEKAVTDMTLRKYEHQLAQLDPNLPENTDQVAQLRAERDGFLIDEARKKVERYPNDLQLRFELGQIYFNAGKIAEAMPELQKAQAHPQRKLQAMGLLGQCFARRNMNDFAARTLQNALKEKTFFDDEKKDLLYALGCVLENMGKRDEAIEQFKQIYEVDMGYKDVAAKVDAHYSASS